MLLLWQWTKLSAASDWLNRLTWDPIDQSQAANTKYCELTQNSTDIPKVSMPNSNIYLCRVWRFTRGPGTGRSSPTRASSSRRWRRRTRATTPARPSTWRVRWSPRPSSWTSCVSGLKTENQISTELCLSIVQSNRPVSRNRNWFTEFLRKRQPTFPALSTPIPELTPSSGLWTQLQVETAAGMRMNNSSI